MRTRRESGNRSGSSGPRGRTAPGPQSDSTVGGQPPRGPRVRARQGLCSSYSLRSRYSALSDDQCERLLPLA
eukprot:11159131-Alexandrium_andersonii.AAC.1